jgi:DNA-binding GntR family transcriptional regulator
MRQTARRPRHNHVELAQRILDVAIETGMVAGDRLTEQGLAGRFNVSRTPVRAALGILAEQGVARYAAEAGYRLAVDPAALDRAQAALPSSDEEVVRAAVLRDRAARRLGESETVASLVRRYGVGRSVVQSVLKRLAEEQIVERAPGRLWVFRPAPDDVEGLAESYDLRLALEPAALTAPGFRLDGPMASLLRQTTERLAAADEPSFDVALFHRSDHDFHTLIAQGCGNRFIREALLSHHRRRRSASAAHTSVFRLRQAAREHLDILDQIERSQMELAADLMRVHLRLSRSQRPRLANRGAPALFRAAPRLPGTA